MFIPYLLLIVDILHQEKMIKETMFSERD